MRIGVIFTGGTIGSQVNQGGYIATNAGSPYILLSMYEKKHGSEIEFISASPYEILSENMDGEHLLMLEACVGQMLEQRVDGIIVTHGTDTLQYSSAFLSYVFGAATVPIVVVSSNYVLADDRANGLTNFSYGVEFIKGGYGTGVFVSYCNGGDVPRIHRGNRLQPPVPYSDWVGSVCDGCYGWFTSEGFCKNPAYSVEADNRSCLIEDRQQVRLLEQPVEILRITPYVGLQYPSIPDSVQAVLHESFHSGTIGITPSFRRFLREAEERGIPVFLTGLMAGEREYATVQEYRAAGVVPLTNTAAIAQYMKLWLAISNEIPLSKIMWCSVAEDWV